MKKKYIKPTAEIIEMEVETGFLANSYIDVEGGTDHFDDEPEETEEPDIIWKWMEK